MSRPSRSESSPPFLASGDSGPSVPSPHQPSAVGTAVQLTVSIMLAVGFTALALGVWFNDITDIDGYGVNFGAVALEFLGGLVGALGGVLLLVAAAMALVTRARM